MSTTSSGPAPAAAAADQQESSSARSIDTDSEMGDAPPDVFSPHPIVNEAFRKLSITMLTGSVAGKWKRKAQLSRVAREKIRAAKACVSAAAALGGGGDSSEPPSLREEDEDEDEAAEGGGRGGKDDGEARPAQSASMAPPPRLQRRRPSLDGSSGSSRVLLRTASTRDVHTNSDDQYTATRQKLHSRIIKSFMRGVVRSSQPTLLLMMGAPGAGKNSILPRVEAYQLAYPKRFVELNTDDAMAALPEYWDFLIQGAHKNKTMPDLPGASEASTQDDWVQLFRDEAKHLVKEAAKVCLRKRRSVVWNGTGKDLAKYQGLADEFRAAGYRIHLVCVYVEADEAWRRVCHRADQIGRSVPEDLVRRTANQIPLNFMALAPTVDGAELYNTMYDPGYRVWRQIGGRSELSSASTAAEGGSEEFFRKYQAEWGPLLPLLPLADQPLKSPAISAATTPTTTGRVVGAQAEPDSPLSPAPPSLQPRPDSPLSPAVPVTDLDQLISVTPAVPPPRKSQVAPI